MQNKLQQSRLSDIRQKAFINYLEMGRGRSIKALAKKMDFPKQTLEKWSREYGWADEIERIGVKIKQEVESAISVESGAVAAQCKNIAKAATAMIVNKLRAMNRIGMTPDTRWSDLDKIVRLFAELHGILTPNQQTGVVINNTNNPLIPNLSGDLLTLKNVLEKMDPHVRVEVLKALDAMDKDSVVDAEVVDNEQESLPSAEKETEE